MEPKKLADLQSQLRRQSLWLKESYLWLLNQKVLADSEAEVPVGPRPTALDVGCGPGFVMEALSPVLEVAGVDCDPDMVAACRTRGLEVTMGDAASLPFPDDAFEVVYCTFLLLWVPDPVKVVSEMRRVARRWVLCLAEPDYGARIDHPEALSRLTALVIEGLKAEGGDPLVGRKLRSIYARAGLEAEIGVHAGVWDLERLAAETADEWRWVKMTVAKETPEGELEELKDHWRRALAAGSLFQYNPVFYGLGRK